jgi:hypothetical protein
MKPIIPFRKEPTLRRTCLLQIKFVLLGIAFGYGKYRGAVSVLSMDILHRKTGAGDAIGKGCTFP